MSMLDGLLIRNGFSYFCFGGGKILEDASASGGGAPPRYTRKNLTTCNKSANKPSKSCVRTACSKLSTSLEQVVNNL